MLFAIAGLLLAPFVPQLVHADLADYRDLTFAFALTTIGTAFSLASQNSFLIPYAWQRTGEIGLTRLSVQILELAVIWISIYLGKGVVALGIGSAVSGLFGFVVAGASIDVTGN